MSHLKMECKSCGGKWEMTENVPSMLVCQKCGSGNVSCDCSVSVSCQFNHVRTFPAGETISPNCPLCDSAVRQNTLPLVLKRTIEKPKPIPVAVEASKEEETSKEEEKEEKEIDKIVKQKQLMMKIKRLSNSNKKRNSKKRT
jgi:hypothetical protein